MHNYRTTRKRNQAFKLTDRHESPLDLYEHLPFQISILSNLLQLNKDASVKDIIDLEPRELRVILNIGSYMPVKAADIAYQSRLDSYTVSRAVKTLKEFGMVSSEMRETNKKEKFLTLTEKGLEIYNKLCVLINERTHKLEEVLTDTEKVFLMEILAKLEDKAEGVITASALQRQARGINLSADQKELIRWYKKSAS